MKRKAPEGKGNGDSDDGKSLKLWRCNEKVTLVDNDGDGFAHGVIIDGEPCPSVWLNSSMDNSEDPPAFWVLMKVTSVTNNAVDLPSDSCFAHDGADLSKSQLRPKALEELEEGILIWHDYVRPRMLASKTVKKSRTKELVKGSKKKGRR